MPKRQELHGAVSPKRVADMPDPPPVRNRFASDAWTREFHRRRFDERLARIDAAVHTSRMALAGARMRSLPSRALGVVGCVLLGSWLRNKRT